MANATSSGATRRGAVRKGVGGEVKARGKLVAMCNAVYYSTTGALELPPVQSGLTLLEYKTRTGGSSKAVPLPGNQRGTGLRSRRAL
jgi:hypothetical protein